MVDNTYTGIPHETKVCEMFIPGGQQWDVTKVYSQLLTMMLIDFGNAYPKKPGF